MKIILYTTHCPKCEILEKKLKEANISFTTNENVKEMLKLGMASAPNLSIDGEILDFGKAVKWINEHRN